MHAWIMKKHNKSRKIFKMHNPSHPHVNERIRIHRLPGYGKELPSNTYVSYMRLPNTDKHLHYWFIESEHDPKNAPVFFWTNGGPGCSSLLGLFEEIGPFIPNSKLNLVKNEFAWTKFANIIFIDQPVGVGFSYSKHYTDYNSNDELAAQDNLAFLIEFFKVFPEFKPNKLFLTGESYAGHYIPMLLDLLVAHNKKHDHEYNLKGIILMNPLMSYAAGDPSEMETYWGHQRIARDVWEKYKKHRCTVSANNRYCKNMLKEMHDREKKMNPYAMSYPICSNSNHQSKQLSKYLKQTNTFTRVNKTRNVNMSCIDKHTSAYLNSTAVRNKIIKPHSNRNWYGCTDYEFYRLKDGNNDMVKYIRNHLSDKELQNLDILIMSGTDDSVCGTVGTQRWISRLKLKAKANTKEWKPYVMDDNLKGHVTIFQGDGNKTLTLVTVNHAGHEIPTYKPAVAYYVVEQFVKRAAPIVQ
jgi:carboxypeptidase C (cathepsin A)